jgi:hypothetical protein
MQFQKTPIALAVLALCGALPFAAEAAPTVSWSGPTSGKTISGRLNPGANCQVTATSTRRVVFFLDTTQLNTDTAGSPWGCAIDTTRFKNGTHTLKAVAYDAAGVSRTAQISVNIQNGTTTPPPTTPPPTTPPPTTTLPPPGSATSPNVWFKSPVSGNTLSGTRQLSTCYVAANGVNRVQFFLDSTALNNDTNVGDGMSCVLDTTKFSNGAHKLVAMGYNASGASYREEIGVTIQNGTTPPPPPPPPDDEVPPPTGSLPSTNTSAVATFHSLGLYWKPPSNPGAAGCNVRYKKANESAWKEGLPMWYDSRNSECRGSLVLLTPGTDYQVQFAMPGQTPVAQVNTKTWSENFPIAKTVYVASGSSTLNITEGGTASGYVLYTAAPGTTAVLDGNKAVNNNISVSAPFVIIRGLTLKGAKQDAISLKQGTKDIVIEDNDISDWGSYAGWNSTDGWKVGVNMQSGISAMCRDAHYLERSIIQRNKIHHPTYGSNSWSDAHPSGPNAVLFWDCGGNHVIRYNEIYSEASRYFMDGIGGGENFSNYGMPTSDSDIYGNKISQVWDDAIESEGANNNVRIWGNYFDQTATGVATTSTAAGPIYVFRNVYNRSRMMSLRTLDNDDRNTFAKSGNSSYGNGRRFIFHNTNLQATQAGATFTLGAGGGINGAGSTSPLTNTVSRNNVWHIWKDNWPSIDQKAGGNANDVNYDLFNGGIIAGSGQEPNGIVGKPIYAPGHGWQNEAGGNYQLAPSSPGYDKGLRLPNFNDDFTGAAPDMGAHEAGKPAMKFGRQ